MTKHFVRLSSALLRSVYPFNVRRFRRLLVPHAERDFVQVCRASGVARSLDVDPAEEERDDRRQTADELVNVG